MEDILRIYVDTNIFIYAIERPAQVDVIIADQLIRLLVMKTGNPKLTLHSGELSLAELLVIPYRNNDDILSNRYEDLFACNLALKPSPISLQVLRGAAKLRSEIPALKLLDALHYATAIELSCTHFLTADRILIGQITSGTSGLIPTEPSASFFNLTAVITTEND